MKTRRSLLKLAPALFGAAILPTFGLENIREKSIYWIDVLNSALSCGHLWRYSHPLRGGFSYNEEYYISACILKQDGNTCRYVIYIPRPYTSDNIYYFIVASLGQVISRRGWASLQFVFIDSRLRDVMKNAEINKIRNLLPTEALSASATNTINDYKQHGLLS